MINISFFILLIAEPIYGLHRLIKSQKIENTVGFILNPMLYFWAFSYLYFLLPGTIIDIYPSMLGYKFSYQVISKVKLLYLLYNTVFFSFYLLSKDYEVSIEKDFLYRYRKILLFIFRCLTLILLFVVITEFPRIYRLRSNRIVAFDYYTSHVYGRYKITFINISVIVLSFLLFLDSKKTIRNKVKFLFPCLLILLLDYSHGGRSESIKVIIEFFILALIELKRLPIKWFLIGIVILVVPTFLQRSVGKNNLIVAFGEFFFTGMTPLVVLGKNLSRSFSELSLNFWVSPFPGFIRRMALGDVDYYWVDIEKNFGYGFGLAGNLLSEGLVYGSNLFVLINPFLISCMILLFNKIYSKNLFCFISSFLFILTSQNIMRTSFWQFYLPIFYMTFVYFIYLINLFNRKVCIKNVR